MRPCPGPIACDLARETLAASELDLADQRDGYRLTLQIAIAQLADREQQARRQSRRIEQLIAENRGQRERHEHQLATAREEYRRLRDELRRLRASLLSVEVAA